MGHVGAPWEWTVGNYFRRQGYTVIRSYKSLGLWDLMCFKKHTPTLIPSWTPNMEELKKDFDTTEVLAVQVKATPWDPYPQEEKDALKAWAEPFGGKAIYAYGKRMPLKHKIKGSRQRLQKNRSVVIEYL